MTPELPSIELQTYDAQKVFRFLDVEVDHKAGELSAILEVQANGFGCKKKIWMGFLPGFLQELEAMDSGKIGKARMWDDWTFIPEPSDDNNHITFSLDTLGHVLVSGTIVEGDYSQRLQFCFQTDQTILRPFIRDLTALIPPPKTK